MEPRIFKINKIGTSILGYISILEEDNSLLPFNIKRVYWTYFTPNYVKRGGHAHKKLKQIIVAVSGTIHFKLENRKGAKYKFTLDRPDKGLYIPQGYWRDIQFSHNAVLLCLASEKYTEEDYIRDYEEFKCLNK